MQTHGLQFAECKLPNPLISLDYSPQANFPSFNHENGLLAKKPLTPAQVHLALPLPIVNSSILGH